MIKQNEIAEVTYRIVTPLFCGGSDPKLPELRLSSFKGALRFWWRSLQTATVTGPAELHRVESQLFGASRQDIGQSQIQMRLVTRNLQAPVFPPAQLGQGRWAGAHYLGYGIMEAFDSAKKGTKAGQLTRGMLPGGTFTVELRFSRAVPERQRDLVLRACVLLGTIGGMGSKSRKGYGSLTVTRLRKNGNDQSISADGSERLRLALNGVLMGAALKTSKELPAWTGWSTKSRVVKVSSQRAKRPLELLDEVGREQMHFRSWGQNGRVLNLDSERNFPLDHDLSKGKIAEAAIPFRAAFGLPHNYGKGPAAAVEPEVHDRRGAPLFIHIDQADDGAPPTALVAMLPALFLPHGEGIDAFGRRVTPNENAEFWFPLHAFLDRLVSQDRKPADRPGYENFPASSKWWHRKTELGGEEVNFG